MSTGRPTKYSKEMLERAKQYVDGCEDGLRQVLSDVNDKTKKKIFKYEVSVNLPKAEGLALYLEVTRSTLYEWAEKHEEFSDILERINQIQADRVINKALAGQYNPLIAKLLLGKHGYKDQRDITSDNEPIFKPTPEQREKANKALRQIKE